ncbi:MAG: hypothetical protein ACREXO_03570 [Advenella sp.]
MGAPCSVHSVRIYIDRVAPDVELVAGMTAIVEIIRLEPGGDHV